MCNLRGNTSFRRCIYVNPFFSQSTRFYGHNYKREVIEVLTNGARADDEIRLETLVQLKPNHARPPNYIQAYGQLR